MTSQNKSRQQHSTKIPTNIGESLISQKIDFFLEEPSSTAFYPLFCENFLCWSSNAQLENLENFWYFTLCCSSTKQQNIRQKNVKPYIPLQRSSGNFKKSWIFLMKINFSKLLNYNAIFFHNSNKLWIFHKDKEDLIVVCHSITMLWKKNSKRCILPVLRQKSTQKSQSSNAEEPAQNALVIQLQNYPKNIRRKYLLRWNFFFLHQHI